MKKKKAVKKKRAIPATVKDRNNLGILGRPGLNKPKSKPAKKS